MLAGLLSLLVVFHETIASGMDRIIGDTLDGFIQLAIIQHWANVLHGAEPWSRTGYFYPWPDTLAYNDGYLLHGLIYTLARAAGLDPFLAETASFAVLRAAGFAGFLLFARRAFRLRFAPALLGAVLFTIASNAAMQIRYGQLFAVGLTPWFAWLVWEALAALRERRDRAAILWGWAASALLGAWLLTGFYVAWFTCFGLLLALLAAPALTRVRPVLRWPLLPIAAGAVLAALPCLLLYLPQARQTGGHGYGEVLLYLPTPLDLVHIGRANVLFGWLDAWLNQALRPEMPDDGTHLIGYAPLLLALALGGGVIAWRERRAAPLRWATVLVVVTATLLSLRFGSFSLWHAIYVAMPGAGAVRVVSRIAIVLAFPVTLLAMTAFGRIRRPWIALPLALLLVTEELSRQELAGVDRQAELAFLAAVPPAPAGCSVFYVRNQVARHLSHTWIDDIYPHNTDAMLIASLRLLPTVNGISTFNPPDWVFGRPGSAGYLRDVADYLRAHDLSGRSCGLDLASLTWQPGPPGFAPAAALALGVTHRFGDKALDANLDSGWEAAGPVGRWTTARRARLSLTLPLEAVGHALALDLGGLPIVWPNGGTSPITLVVNGQTVTTWHPVAGRQHLRAEIPAALVTKRALSIVLEVARPRSPSEMGQSPDQRALGFFVLTLRLEITPS